MRKLYFIIAGVLIAAALVFLLFEPVSTEVEKNKAVEIADRFDEVAAKVMKTDSKPKNNSKRAETSSGISDEATEDGEAALPTREQLLRLYEDSKAYNKRIVNNQGTVSTTDYTSAALRLSDYGIWDNLYGYISAPAIGMKLPVYLGADEAELNSGAAHLCNTSLPLNMNNTNCAIAGHTGYFGRIFFDDIGALKRGDEVSLKNYWQTIKYRVREKKTVSPKNTSDLVIQNGKALLTLITCVSNGKGGFDRTLVICEKTN